MRRLVGADDDVRFDNPSGDLIWPFLGEERYRSVFDFGCGCGRIARKLLQQRVRPERYLGVDLHRGMVAWCQRHLSTVDPNFEFAHHDTAFVGFNPGPDKPHIKAFDAPDGFATLAIAISVFTHLLENQAAFYLREIARVLRPDGAFIATWFTFDKREFPMMQTFQNALYINLSDPGNAVVYDREWVRRTAREAGLRITQINPPAMRGSHWRVVMTPEAAGLPEAEWPEDTAPLGDLRPPLLPAHVDRIGIASSAEPCDRYDRSYYLGDCGGFAEFELFRGRILEDPRLAAVHALTAARSGDRVLDIRCGRSELSRAFAVDGASVTAIDYSGDALEIARETAGGEPVRFVCGDATAFTNSDGFDLAVASDVIEHLATDELDRLYRNVSQMLRPSGNFVVHTWPNAWMYRYGYPRRRAEAALRGETLPDDPRTPYEQTMHINEQSPNRLRRQLRAHFPHVIVWLGTADDPRGSLVREFTRDDAHTASDVYAYASHRPIDVQQLLTRITSDRLDVDGDAIAIAEAAAPARVGAGEPFIAEVMLANRSEATLSSFMPYPVRFAYLWFDESGASVGNDRGRSLIAPAAHPHDERHYAVRVVAPDSPGRFRLRVTVVQEFVRWFGACGEVVVDVDGAPAGTAKAKAGSPVAIGAEPSPLTEPTTEMIYRVTGQRDRAVFDDSAVPSVESIEAALGRLGRTFDDVRSVFDFACGCGRIARTLMPRSKNAEYTGADIDATAIEFLRAELKPGRFFVNGDLPPLPLDDETFDLVFGWSIFTHFDESCQDAWLAEIRRITKPGGSVLLTVSGDASWEWLVQNSDHPRLDELLGLRAHWHKEGFVFWDRDGWDQHFPPYYHTAFHTPEYVRQHWSRWFAVVDVVPGGALSQDMVILRRPLSP